MAYEFNNSDESPKWKVVDLSGWFFFSPAVQDRDQRSSAPSGLFHGHHIVPTNLFNPNSVEFGTFWQGLVIAGYRQDDPLTNQAWLPASLEDALRIRSELHSTNHTEYDNFIIQKLTEMKDRAGLLPVPWTPS